MRPSTTLRPPRRSALLTIALAAAAAVLTASGAAASGGAPAVVHRTDDGFATVSRGGAQIYDSGRSDAQFLSLDRNVLALSQHAGDAEEVVLQDATTGRVLARVPDAFAPVLADGGRQVAFLPERMQARRDKYGNSVWLRQADGTVRKIVQFSTGDGLPGVDTGMHGENSVLSYGLDDKAQTLVVTQGNDVDLFLYDIWVVDVATGDPVRLTSGETSRWPTLSQDGAQVAYVRENAHCGGEGPGYRAGDIELVRRDGTGRRVLLEGDCARFHTDPRWLSKHELATAVLTRTGEATYDVALSVLDLRTGTTRIVARDITGFTASTTNRTLAWSTGGEPGYTMQRPGGRPVHVAEGGLPELSGDRAG